MKTLNYLAVVLLMGCGGAVDEPRAPVSLDKGSLEDDVAETVAAGQDAGTPAVKPSADLAPETKTEAPKTAKPVAKPVPATVIPITVEPVSAPEAETPDAGEPETPPAAEECTDKEMIVNSTAGCSDDIAHAPEGFEGLNFVSWCRCLMNFRAPTMTCQALSESHFRMDDVTVEEHDACGGEL